MDQKRIGHRKPYTRPTLKKLDPAVAVKKMDDVTHQELFAESLPSKTTQDSIPRKA